MNCPADITTISSSAQWRIQHRPYRHVLANNVLTSSAYDQIALEFRTILAGSNDDQNRYRLRKSRSTYDARIMSVNNDVAERFAPFFSQAFIAQLYRMFSIPYLGLVSGALHSSEPNSRTGAIHTDFCSAWFDQAAIMANPPEVLTFPDHSRIAYFTGVSQCSDVSPQRFARAVALIFYLENDNWKPGHGGETGLYGASRQSPNTLVSLVPPYNNSLIAFECTPHSYHRFVTNPGGVRNSLVLWIHTTVEEAESRWGNTIEMRNPT